jgi:hypothetical protein
MSRPDPDLLASVRQIALPDPDLVSVPGPLVISDHAIQRYRERVEGVPRKLAARRLDELARTAAWRARPLAWTRVVLHPGVIYGYSVVRRDVCLFAHDGTLLTVMSRRFLDEAEVRRARSAA